MSGQEDFSFDFNNISPQGLWLPLQNPSLSPHQQSSLHQLMLQHPIQPQNVSFPGFVQFQPPQDSSEVRKMLSDLMEEPYEDSPTGFSALANNVSPIGMLPKQPPIMNQGFHDHQQLQQQMTNNGMQQQQQQQRMRPEDFNNQNLHKIQVKLEIPEHFKTQSPPPYMVTPASPMSEPSSMSSAAPSLIAAAAARPEIKRVIEQLEEDMEGVFSKMDKMHQEQYDFFFGNGPSLNDIHGKILAYLDNMFQLLDQVTEKAPLLPAELQRRDDMALAIEILKKRVAVYQVEYEKHRSNPSNTDITAALVIVKQPFPCLVLQQQQLLGESLAVQLFTGVRNQILEGGEVEALLQGENLNTGIRAKKRKAQMGVPVAPSAKMLENQVHKMMERTASLPVKFLLSSEKKVCHLKFALRAKDVKGSFVELESEQSQPLFILCHQNQFAYCEGELLKKEAFGGNIMPIAWPRLANCLQRQFTRTIRQAERSEEYIRSLSMLDICYIHHKRFDGGPRISVNAFEKFWEWYGKFLHMFRYQRHIAKMWQRGLILPFIGRETAECLLGSRIGTFLLRPSDAFPGQLVISYINPSQNILHYLVSHEDIAKKSLAAFILEKNLLGLVLQLDTRTLEDSWTQLSNTAAGSLNEVPAACSLSVTPVPKAVVFADFCRNKSKNAEKEEDDTDGWRYVRDATMLTTLDQSKQTL